MRADVYKIFENKKIVLKDLKEIDLKEFTKKITLRCFEGIDAKGFYNIIFIREAKSRFLKNEFEDILKIYSAIEAKLKINFKKRTLFYNSDICSKTRTLMEEANFKYDFM